MIDLLGREIEIMGYPDASLLGRKGKIVLETKKTLIIQTNTGRKVMVMKANLVLKHKDKVIYGGSLLGDMAYRIKKGW